MSAFEVVTQSNPRDQWLEARKSGIGSSDMAAVLGVTARKDPVRFWLERTGRAEPEDLDDVDLVQCGTDLEDAIRDRIYPRKSGRPSRRDGRLLRSTVHPWATCTLDGWTCEPGQDFHPLEIKNVAGFNEAEWENGAPLQYRVQCQHQLLVTACRKVTICALIGGCKPVWEDIDRDERVLKLIVERGSDMWRRIQEDDPPPPNDSESCATALRLWYPDHTERKTIELPGEYRDIESEYEALSAEIGEREKRKRHIANTIKAAMGDAEFGVFYGGGSFSWRTARDGKRTLRHHPRKEL